MSRSFYSRGDVSSVGAIRNRLPSMTKQEFREECDVNNILRQYVNTGLAPGMQKPGLYGDFSNVGDFHSAQNIIARANEQFDALPSDVRERFRNNPAEMLKFVADKSNEDEARKLGLLAPLPADAATSPVVASGEPSKASP